MGAVVGRAPGRGTAHARPPAGGLRRLPDPHRRPDRPRPLLARAPRGDGQHPRHGLLGQRRQRGGGTGRQLQRAPVHRAHPGVGGREPRPLRRLGRLQHLQPLCVGLGLGGQHAAQALEALHLAGRDPHAADRALARPHRRAGRRAATVRPRHRSHADHPAGRRPRGAGAGRRGAPAAGGRREPPVGARGSGGPRAPSHPVLRDDGLAVHLPRGVEGDDQPHQHRRPRRGGAGGGQPQLRRGPLGALRPLERLLRGDRPGRCRAEAPPTTARPVGRRGAAQQGPPHFRRPGRPLRGLHPSGLARRAVAHVPPGRWRGRRRVGPAPLGRLRHHGRHRHRPGRGGRRRLRPGRLVRRLRAVPGRRAGPLHVRPRRRRARAGTARRARRRAPRDHGLLRRG